jgi:hypothetical protein
MRTAVAAIVFLGFVMISSATRADSIIFFQEQFTGSALDAAAWRTEILTSGPRFCHDSEAPWAPGHWIDEGVECHGVAAHSPYGSAPLSDGLLALSSSNVRAFPILVNRSPGSVPLFPDSGDLTLTLRMRYDRVTPWGTGVVVLQKESTEPIGNNYIFGPPEDILMHLWCDSPGGPIRVLTAIGGSIHEVGTAWPATDFHEFELACVGTLFTISVDGEVVYGPVSSALRPTAMSMGNDSIAFWYPTDWTSFSVDYVRVEVPGPVPVVETTWGAMKSMYRD